MTSQIEEQLNMQLLISGIPPFERQTRLIPGRKFSCDFYWPDYRLIVECEGGTWMEGRHTRGGGFEKDCWKYNELSLMGYTVLRFTGGQIDTGYALHAIMRALKVEDK